MSSPPSAQNETRNFQVTFLILYNGTLVHQNPDPVLETVELVLLVIVFLISLCGNTFLLVTIASSYTLREESFNALLVNFCAIFLIETVVNMSIAVLYVAADTWHLGHVGCAISSFTVQIVTMEITFGLSMMSLQSMILMKHPYEFQKVWTLKKQSIAILTFWAAGFLLCLPLLLESIQSDKFPLRYGCAFTGYDGFVYMLFITIWCYGIMIIIGIGCLINVAIQQYKEYKAQARKNSLNYSEVFIPGGLWTEWINVKLVAWLTLFYLILELPYIVMHHTTGLKYHSTNNSTSQETSLKHETVFTWFRYLYSCFFACIAFKIRKDIRYKFRNLLPCCRRNVVRDHSPVPIVKQDNKKKDHRKNSIPPISLSTPVLYISSEGLCLRQLAPETKSFMNYSENDKLKKAPNFITYLCDVEPVSVTTDSPSNLDESSNSMYRRSSKESEVSLTEFGYNDSFKNVSQDIPLKDLDSNISEPLPKSSPEQNSYTKPLETSPKKKTVRFSDTVTFYRALTPEVMPEMDTLTPGWVTTTPSTQNVETNIKSRHSKIPTLVHSINTSPWKIERNRTYAVKSPPPRQGYQITRRGSRNSTEFRRENNGTPILWRFSE